MFTLKALSSFVKPLRHLTRTGPLKQASVITMNIYKPPPPCKVGDGLELVDTPALLVDLDIMEANMAVMDEIMKKYPDVSVRPHYKAHKCPELAKMQMQHTVEGICCQTLVEAESLAYTGAVKDIYLTNQLIGLPKLKRFAALAKTGARLSICVDDAENIKQLSQAAQEENVTVDCVVEVNVGQNRCGVIPGDPAVALAKAVLEQPGLNLKGLHCYQGMNQHIRTPKDRQSAVDSVAEKSQLSIDSLKKAGIPCNYVTGGGTGTFQYEAKSGIFTEVQPGSYIFMDADYNRNLDQNGTPLKDFKQSLFILGTIQSVTKGERAVVDAGLKALSIDSGMPLVDEHADITYESGGDEHGVLSSDGNFKVGDQIRLIPGHCDPTVNMYDWLVGVRKGVVETVWPILGRGPGV